jgi:phenylacetic acid degradation operon negative regulatory protein
MARSRALEDMARALLARSAPRAKSLIVTVFGDAIAPHGGAVWLGSLIALMAPFGVNERLVRTAVLRLSREAWLMARPLGRRSYYSLTESGRLRFEDAHRRIYAGRWEGSGGESWTGDWHLVILPPDSIAAAERERLRRELAWLGFGQLGPTLLAHPSPDGEALGHVLQALGLIGRVAVMRARSDALTRGEALPSLVRAAWDLDALARAYRDFLALFRPVGRALEARAAPDPAACFLIRVLLIHAFRRVLLRDPELPEELLPSDWAGKAARRLCRDIYRRAAEPAERHLMALLETAEGPLPAAGPSFHDRFGGIDPGAGLSGTAAE